MSFAGDIGKANDAIAEALRHKLRSSAIAVLSSVVKRTPVDTGRLRGNWQVDVNSAPSGVVEEGMAHQTINAGKRKINKAKGGDTIYIVNNLPYANAIEWGHGENNEPGGMVGVTVAEFKRIVGDA